MNKKLLITLLAIVLIVTATFFGAELICPWNMSSTDSLILTKLRIPRVILAFITGASLGCCGLMFQTIFHSQLATPYTLGVASGASFGAIVGLLLCGTTLFWLVPITAFIGALITIMLIIAITRCIKQFSIADMLLAGVAVNLFFASLIILVQYIGTTQNASQVHLWLLGGLSSASYNTIIYLAITAGTIIGIFYHHNRELDQLIIGEVIAQSRGVEVKRVRNRLTILASILTGVVVSISGPIGFVGMIIPHTVKMIFGIRHKNTIIFSALIGGLFLVICDTIAQMVLSHGELPVGVITALCGGPFFIYILISEKRER